jgi:hypothetical protein
MELKIRLKLFKKRKNVHINQLEKAIAATHGDIVKHVLEGNQDKAQLKARLFLKYNRRLKYISA